MGDQGNTLARHRQIVRVAKQVRLLQGKDLTFEQMAHELNLSLKELKAITRTAAYRRLQSQWTMRPEDHQSLEEAADVPTVVKEAKAELALDTIEYYRDCYQRNPEELWAKKGKWLDPELAQWAAERLGKGIGLLEPEQLARPTITIHLGAIGQVLSQVAQEDARAARALDVTPAQSHE